MKTVSAMFVITLLAVSLSFAQHKGGGAGSVPAQNSEVVVTKPTGNKVQKVREANSKKGHKGGKKGHKSHAGKASLPD